jgi:hypothetical protein
MAATTRMAASRRYLDPVSLTLLASSMAFCAQLVATSKHFAFHYMTASWVLTGGVLVLTAIETVRLFPGLPPQRVLAGAAAIGVVLITTTLFQIRSDAANWIAINDSGARLSKLIEDAAPACANVSSVYVHAPENEMNTGAGMTLETEEMLDRFSEAYARAIDVPLLHHASDLNAVLKNFRRFSYAQLAADYPCIVVRTADELDAENSGGLLEWKPDHCVIDHIHLYTTGIACHTIKDAAAVACSGDQCAVKLSR